MRQISGSNILIKANDISICYNDLGAGSQTMIFIHGFPFDKTSWHPQLEYFKNHYRVIAFDIRGYGKSEKGNEDFSIKLFADDLIALMDALLIEKAIVCGLSMGGYILLNALSRYPERIQAAILCDTQCNSDSPEAKEKRYKTMEVIEENGLNHFADGIIKNVFTKATQAGSESLVESIKQKVLLLETAVVAGTLKALADRNETCSVLGKVNVPTLILGGADDTITPPQQLEFIHKNIPGSEMHIIEQAAHLSNLEQPEKFNSFVDVFVKKILK